MQTKIKKIQQICHLFSVVLNVAKFRATLHVAPQPPDKFGVADNHFLLTFVCFHLSFTENIIQRYGNLPGVLHMIELEKGKTGLGLSLAGNRDRSRMSVFVVGIDPSGAAGRDGRMVVGDELLEVRLLAIPNVSIYETLI